MHTNFRDIEGQIMIKTGKEAEKEIEKILLEKIELASSHPETPEYFGD
jgi:hypothetical protein